MAPSLLKGSWPLPLPLLPSSLPSASLSDFRLPLSPRVPISFTHPNSMEESVHLRGLDLSTCHTCTVIITCEHGSASVTCGQNFINERLGVRHGVGSVLLVKKIVVVQVRGDLAGIEVTGA